MRTTLLLLLFVSAAIAKEPISYGQDLKGNWRACHPMKSDDEICTYEYTEGDQYKDECEALGGEAVQCGCHDYLCIRVSK